MALTIVKWLHLNLLLKKLHKTNLRAKLIEKKLSKIILTFTPDEMGEYLKLEKELNE